MSRAFFAALASMLLAACGDSRPPPAPVSPAPPAAPEEPTLPPGPCSPIWRVSLPVAGADALALGVTEGATWVLVAPAGTTALEASRIDAEGHLGATVRRAGDGPRGVLAVEPVGDRFVVVTSGRCPEDSPALVCLGASSLDAGGFGTPTIVPVPEPLRSERHAVDGNTLLLARSHNGAGASLDRFTLSADGTVTHTNDTLVAPQAGETRVSEALGLAARDGHWAAVVREGFGEQRESAVWLVRDDGVRKPIDALQEALAVDAMALVADGAELVATFEYARPHVVRFDAAGEIVESTVHPPNTPLPASLRARRRALLAQRPDGDELVRFDAAGDRLADTQPLRGHATASAIARREGGFVVARAIDGTIELLALSCRDE